MSSSNRAIEPLGGPRIRRGWSCRAFALALPLLLGLASAITPVKAAPLIVVQPSNQAVVVSLSAQFSVGATSALPLSFQWQGSMDGGTSWTNLSNGGGYGYWGANEATLSVYMVYATMSGFRYRALVSDALGSVTSSVALLSAYSAPVIKKQPLNQSATQYVAAVFTVAVTGVPPPQVRWESSPDGSFTWVPDGILPFVMEGRYTPTLMVYATSSEANGYEFRAIVSNEVATVVSVGARLTVLPPNVPANFTLQPSNQIVSAGRPATFASAVEGSPQPVCHWQISPDQGNTWNDLDEGGAYNGANAAILTVTTLTGMDGQWFRAVATNSSGTAYSTAVLLTVRPTAAGRVVAWGDNGWGQIIVPSWLGGVMAVSGGFNHSLALRNDGTVVAWGSDVFGQATVPDGLSDVVAISAGYDHNMALKVDGTLVVWGDNTYGQSSIPAGLNNLKVKAISAGYGHSLAVKADGSVVGWGWNVNGQITVPTAARSGVVAVSAGYIHSMALLSNGTVVTWGDNFWHQRNVPAGLSGVTGIAAGDTHSVAVKSDGTVVAWGGGTTSNGPLPEFGQCIVPAGLAGVALVEAGGYHTVAARADGSLAAWGYNHRGQATARPGLRGVTAIGAGYYHTLVVTTNPATAIDFDGDCQSDLGCYFAPGGNWFLMQSAAGFKTATFGFGGTVPVVGDFDGDGKCDYGCYYAPGGNWYLMQSSAGFKTATFGYDGTVPVVGDFDGDGKCDYGCYYAPGGNWYFMQSSAGFKTAAFGYDGTVPVVGDFDGDGKCDYGCYYAPGGNWYLMQSSAGFKTATFGYDGTVPVVGDFDGDGKCDYGCYYAPGGNWYFMQSSAGFKTAEFGYGGTVPVVGDFDGDGKCDYGCYYAPGGNWYLMQSSAGFKTATFGFDGTFPLGQ